MQSPSKVDLQALNANQVLELIQGALSGNNDRIKEATKMLKAYSKLPIAIRTLSYILMNAPDIGSRQMSAVLLRRNIVALYSQLSQPQQLQFRSLLLQRYVNEPQLLVQKSIAALVGSLLSAVEVQKWPQIQQLLDTALKTASDSSATFIFLNNIIGHIQPPAGLYSYLFKALSNPNLVDQALKCMNIIAQAHDVDPSLAIQLIKIWQTADWSEFSSQLGIQLLTIMLQRKVRLSDDVTIWVCDRIVGNRKLSNKLRAAGCDYLQAFADFNNKALNTRQVLLKKIVQTACLVCSQPYKPKDDEQDKGEYVQQIALWLIQSLAAELKAKKVYPVLFEAAVNLINSEDPNKANTGFLVLGATCEGCGQKVKSNLENPIMNVLIPRGLAHSAPQVRGAAINALCYFCEHLVPDIFKYHAVIIPAMVGHVGDLSPKVVGKALIAIDIFFDGMQQQDILQYLPTVIPLVIKVLESQAATPLMKAAAMSSIGSAIFVSQQHFQPYLQQAVGICNRVLQAPPSPQFNSVRAENIQVLGKLANVFCKSTYPKHQLFYSNLIMPTMQKVYLILQGEQQNQIRQAAFAFFYLIANAIGSQFSIVFDKIVPIVLKACELKAPPQKDFSLDTDSQDQQEELQPNVITYKITQQDQKASAIHALGELAKACPSNFTPYFQQAYKILEEHYQHFYENIRIQVCHAYTNVTLGLVKSQLGCNQLPKPKTGLPCLQRYNKALEDHFRTEVLAKLILIMTEDQDKRVRGAAIQSVDDLIKSLGPAFIDYTLQPLKQAIMRLLEAQIDVEQEEQEQQQADEDQTEVQTFEAICDLIPTLAENLLSGFEPTLSQLHPYMLKYVQERQQSNDNVQMTGCLSQCFKWCPGYASNHAQELFRSLSALIPLWDSQINRNIAYCFAELFQKSAQTFAKYLQEGLVSLKQIFDHKSSELPCKDNALAAICRIIYTHNPPLPHQVFLQGLIHMMPFKGDEQEEPAAIKALIFLQSRNPALLTPHKAALIKILENDLAQPTKYDIVEPVLSHANAFLARLRNG